NSRGAGGYASPAAIAQRGPHAGATTTSHAATIARNLPTMRARYSGARRRTRPGRGLAPRRAAARDRGGATLAPMRRILLVTLTFACLATAQRGPLVGEVRDANGEPIAGADVTLVGRPVPWVPELGEADVVVVQSGQDGRFRASLLATTTYSAFAVVERDGAWLASDVEIGRAHV